MTSHIVHQPIIGQLQLIYNRKKTAKLLNEICLKITFNNVL